MMMAEPQPRWGWKTLTNQTQGSLADSATAGLEDGIPSGFADRPFKPVRDGKLWK